MFGKEFENGGEGTLNTIFGPGSKVKATLTIKGAIRIDGTFEGNIKAADTIIVGKSGVVQADITVKSVVVAGKILGNIKAETIKMQNGSHIEGDIETKRLVIEENVFFQGNCKMGTQITSGAKPASPTVSTSKEPEQTAAR